MDGFFPGISAEYSGFSRVSILNSRVFPVYYESDKTSLSALHPTVNRRPAHCVQSIQQHLRLILLKRQLITVNPLVIRVKEAPLMQGKVAIAIRIATIETITHFTQFLALCGSQRSLWTMSTFMVGANCLKTFCALSNLF